MNVDEAIALEALQRLTDRDIVHEPDGNIPPDFLIDGCIAVEVRRLTKSLPHGRKRRDLDEISMPLWHRVERTLERFESKEGERIWFVFIRLQRPIPKWKELRPRVEEALAQFYASSNKSETLRISDNFELEFLQGGTYQEQYFWMGGMSDYDAGGWVVSDIVTNLPIYMEEKARKVAAHKSRYPQWWLVLVDHISYGGNEAEVREHVQRSPAWDKVLIVGPISKQAYEI